MLAGPPASCVLAGTGAAQWICGCLKPARKGVEAAAPPRVGGAVENHSSGASVDVHAARARRFGIGGRGLTQGA